MRENPCHIINSSRDWNFVERTDQTQHIQPIRFIVVHHSATANDASIDDIRNVHVEERGWDDIGYHWLIDHEGIIRQGRREHLIGAHCKGLNDQSIGVCCIGHFEEEEPSNAMIDALVFCLADICIRYGLTAHSIIGHSYAVSISREATPTQCPGSTLSLMLPRVRSAVEAKLALLTPLRKTIRRVEEKISQQFHPRIELQSMRCSDAGDIMLQGHVWNRGSSAWDNTHAQPHEKFRLGYRMSTLQGSLIREGRCEFSTRAIDPGASGAFHIEEKLPDQPAVSECLLEIEVLKEGGFWFSDIGVEPYRMLISREGIFARPELSARIDVERVLFHGDGATLEGEVQNDGRTVLPAASSLQIRCKDALGGHASTMMHHPIEVQQRAPFTIKFSIEQGVPFQVVFMTPGLHTAVGTTPVLMIPAQSENTEIGLEQSKIAIEDIRPVSNGIYRVTGSVKNSGLLAWEGIEKSKKTPIRIGAELRTATGLVWEGRYELPRATLSPGEIVPFSFIVRAFDGVSGRGVLNIDVVRERCYWFASRGSQTASAEIDVALRQDASERRERKYSGASSIEAAHLLVIAPTLPLFDRETGGKRLFTILKRCRDEGISVTFLYEGDGVPHDGDRYRAELDRLGIVHGQGPERFLSAYTGRHFTTAILAWHSVASQYTDLIRALFPACRIVADSVDVHWVRESRGAERNELSFSQEELRIRKQNEIDAYRNVDEVWAVTTTDAEEILSTIGPQRVKVVSNLTTPLDMFPVGGIGEGIIFVGGFTHPPNISSALFSYRVVESWRQQSGSNAPLYIVGNAPPAEIAALHDGVRTIVTGFVEDLTPWYAKSRVMIAPLTYGAGIKGKICDSIAYGVPVITGAIGNEGIHLEDSTEVFLAETEHEYVCALNKVFSASFNATEMARCALEKILHKTGLDTGWPVIRSAFIEPPVVAAIITYNADFLVEQCVTSLLRHTSYSNLRIAIVVNGCEDGTFATLSRIAEGARYPIDIITRATNDFFVRPNNYIMERYPGSDVVLINNDVIFTEDAWLGELVDAAYAASDVGAAGGMLLDLHGRVLEAGAQVTANGYGEQFGKGLDPGDGSVLQMRHVGFVSGALLFMRRAALTQFGIFDARFHPMYYEDVEWQYRLHRFGYKTMYTPFCRAIHAEGSSAGVDTGAGMKRFQELHRRKFIDLFSGAAIDRLTHIS